MINKPSRSGDDNVRILSEHALLHLEVQPSDREGDVDGGKLGELPGHLIHLDTELTGGDEDQDAGHGVCGGPVEEPLQHRQHVGRSLACASGCTSTNVTAEKSDRDGGGLNIKIRNIERYKEK